LETAAAGGTFKDSVARVTVSNHFVRFALVPRVPGLTRRERDALVEHHFASVFGDNPASWRIVASELAPSTHMLGAAIAREFLDRLVEVLRYAGMRVRAIEPYLAKGYNAFRGSAKVEAGWLAVAEPGRACVAYVSEGRWLALRNQRLAAPLSASLPPLLEQTMLATGTRIGSGTVYLVSRDEAMPAFPADSPWSLECVPLSK
jgi:hypothetical protein